MLLFELVLEFYVILFIYVGEYVFEVLGGVCGMSDDDIVVVMVDGCFI